MTTEKVRQHVEQATATREARVAVLVTAGIGNALDLLDEQPAAVLEAMTRHAKYLQESGIAPKHRHELRGALIKYLEERTNEANTRERELAEAVTGEEPEKRRHRSCPIPLPSD